MFHYDKRIREQNLTDLRPVSKTNCIMENTMLKKLLFVFSLMLLATCNAKPTPSLPTPPVDQINVEEQAVYAALLKHMYTANALVIMDTTTTGVDNTNQTLDYILQNMHGVDQATVDSFRTRNEKALSISSGMNIGVAYTLLSQSQRNQIFGQNQSGWEVFYNNYPNTPGITTLSSVGFNAAFDQALVYIGTQSNWLAGAGYYFLLKKGDGNVWTVDQQVMSWIS
jgi:hypothetical protein